MNILRCTLGRTARTTALRPTLLLSASLALLLAPPLSRAGDCDPQIIRGDGFPGADGQVWASVEWDPDGPGPRTPLIVVAGEFLRAGRDVVNRVAVFDPQTEEWSPLDAGFDGAVRALATLPNGDLYAAGMFSYSGSHPVGSTARWNGQHWERVGPGTISTVFALTVLPNGDLVAGGGFAVSGNVLAIARWNGQQWLPFGDGVNGVVTALTVAPNGDLLAGGYFSSAGGVPANNIARWDGQQWSSLGGGVGPGVLAIAALPTGDVLAGGSFTTAQGAPVNGIARWNGAAWSAIGPGVQNAQGAAGSVSALHLRDDASVLIGGTFALAGGVPAQGIALLNETQWSQPYADLGTVRTITQSADGSLYVASNRVYRWRDNTWVSPGFGLDRPIEAILPMPGGDLIVAGALRFADQIQVNGVARWDGVEWSPLGQAVGDANASVACLHRMPNSDVIAGGSFTSIGGVAAQRVARWDGATWSPLGQGIQGSVRALTSLPNNDIVAAGYFTVAGAVIASSIARWDGSEWLPLGAGVGYGVESGSVDHLAVLPNGDLIAAGVFTTAGGVPAASIARWDGMQWHAIEEAPPIYQVSALHLTPNGDLIIADREIAFFPESTQVWRWDGALWHPLGPPIQGSMTDFIHRADGSLLATGAFNPFSADHVPGLAMWTGTHWAQFGPSLDLGPNVVAPLSNGDLALGGEFRVIDGQPAAYFARWTDTNIPWVARHPQPQSIDPSESASFSAWPATGYTNLEASWQLETAPHSNTYADLIDGPIPNSQGATASITPLLPSHRPGATTLTLSNITPSLHYRRVRALINNSCGVSFSNPALLTLNNATCPGDANGDNVVDFLDLNLLLSSFGASVPPGTLGDLNSDGAVDFLDLNILLSYFGTSC